MQNFAAGHMPVPNALAGDCHDLLQALLTFNDQVLSPNDVGNVLGQYQNLILVVGIFERFFDRPEMAHLAGMGIATVLRDYLRFALGHDGQHVLPKKFGHDRRHAKVAIVLAHHGLGCGVVQPGQRLVTRQKITLMVFERQGVRNFINDGAQKRLAGAQAPRLWQGREW